MIVKWDKTHEKVSSLDGHIAGSVKFTFSLLLFSLRETMHSPCERNFFPTLWYKTYFLFGLLQIYIYIYKDLTFQLFNHVSQMTQQFWQLWKQITEVRQNHSLSCITTHENLYLAYLVQLAHCFESSPGLVYLLNKARYYIHNPKRMQMEFQAVWQGCQSRCLNNCGLWFMI